ncbi:MAG TPA: cytochrome c peroxidase, partial [Gemmatimonadales bacterium]|nr:cytochrome c peroxidase [Gemmatimonadales bacterium]
MKTSRLAIGIALLGAAVACIDNRVPVSPPQANLVEGSPSITADLAALGKLIFFDENLSLNSNQSCASCHAPEAGWTGALSSTNAHGAVYEGSVPGAFGARKPPSSAYATQSPILHLSGVKKHAVFTGGMFWDGRATGEILGSPTAEQAKGPFLNPVEQALPTAAALVGLVCGASYGDVFRAVWGESICDPANVDQAYDDIGFSVSAFEGSSEVNAFTSKFDAFRAGQATLTREERRGWALFNGQAKCAGCHVGNGEHALFTDYTFDNIGLPQNPENPAGLGFFDPGLGGFLEQRADYSSYATANLGKHKVPTLRNVDLRPSPDFVKAYGHNGYFK